jgi:two-component system, NarL family, response regulator NreC
MGKIRVLLADDHGIVRAGLQPLINAQPDMEVVAQAASNHEEIQRAHETSPDLVLQDLHLKDGSAIPTIKRLRQELPQTRVLVLTVQDEPAFLRTALAAGAAGYLVKTGADAELLAAIRAVHQGRIFIDMNLRSDAPAASAVLPQPAALSPRELEVLRLLAHGYTNQATADRLYLSVKTVETYRGRIAEKLGLRSRADLVRYAIENGLLHLDSASELTSSSGTGSADTIDVG